MRAMFCWRQHRERKLDVFFSVKKAQDVCRAVVSGVDLHLNPTFLCVGIKKSHNPKHTSYLGPVTSYVGLYQETLVGKKLTAGTLFVLTLVIDRENP
jgi:hypothetical protein